MLHHFKRTDVTTQTSRRIVSSASEIDIQKLFINAIEEWLHHDLSKLIKPLCNQAL